MDLKYIYLIQVSKFLLHDCSLLMNPTAANNIGG